MPGGGFLTSAGMQKGGQRGMGWSTRAPFMAPWLPQNSVWEAVSCALALGSRAEGVRLYSAAKGSLPGPSTEYTVSALAIRQSAGVR